MKQKPHKPTTTHTANELAMSTYAMASRPAWGWLGITALITTATFALYARTLGKQSLWFDEGLSVFFAAKPLPLLLHTLIYEDLHPPFYYLLLHGWMKLAGNSEWAVRIFITR